MPVYVCLWCLCIVVTGCNGSRISLQAWIDGCLYYLLTTPHPVRRMGWCRISGGRGGYGKIGNCSDITYLTYFLSMDHVTYLFIWTILKFFSVILVENALCLKTVRLITTSDHIGLKWRHIVRILPTCKTRNRICVTDIRSDGIKCVTEKCVLHNCVTAGSYSYPSEERFVLELPSSRTILATARPSCMYSEQKCICHIVQKHLIRWGTKIEHLHNF